MAIPGSQTSTNIIVNGPTVGVASAQALASRTERKALIFHMPGAAGTISLVPTSFGAAVLNGAGTITLTTANPTVILDDVRSTDAFNAIADAGGRALTVWEFV